MQAVGLDVLPEEPANPDHPLIKAWAADEEWIDHRLLITPHSAFFTPESVHDMRFKGGEVIVKYLDTGALDNCVNRTGSSSLDSEERTKTGTKAPWQKHRDLRKASSATISGAVWYVLGHPRHAQYFGH